MGGVCGPGTDTRLTAAEQRRVGKAYVAGNVVEGNERVTKDNWDGGVQVEREDGYDPAVILDLDYWVLMPRGA